MIEWFFCEPRSGDRQFVAAVLVLVGPFLIRLATNRPFRDDFLDWLSWDDPFGFRFHKRNFGFLLMHLALFIGFCLSLLNSSAYCA